MTTDKQIYNVTILIKQNTQFILIMSYNFLDSMLAENINYDYRHLNAEIEIS